MRKIVFTIVLLTFITSCKNSKSEDSQDQDLLVNGENVIVLKKSGIQKNKNRNSFLTRHSDGVVSAGTIQAIPNHYAEIASPFSGRITQSFIRLGQNVSANSPLFEILSLIIFFPFRRLHRCIERCTACREKLQTSKDLVKPWSRDQKELDEAETDFKNKKNITFQCFFCLKVYNSKGGGIGSPLIVRARLMEKLSPINCQWSILKSDADPVIIIAGIIQSLDFRGCKEKDIRFVNVGDHVSVKVSAYPGQKYYRKSIPHQWSGRWKTPEA